MTNKSLTDTLLRSGVDGVGAHELTQLLSKAPSNMSFAAAGAWLAGLRVNREAALNAEARTARWANPYIPNEYKRLLDAQEQGKADDPANSLLVNSSSREVLAGGKAVWLDGPLLETDGTDATN